MYCMSEYLFHINTHVLNAYIIKFTFRYRLPPKKSVVLTERLPSSVKNKPRYEIRF